MPRPDVMRRAAALAIVTAACGHQNTDAQRPADANRDVDREVAELVVGPWRNMAGVHSAGWPGEECHETIGEGHTLWCRIAELEFFPARSPGYGDIEVRLGSHQCDVPWRPAAMGEVRAPVQYDAIGWTDRSKVVDARYEGFDLTFSGLITYDNIDYGGDGFKCLFETDDVLYCELVGRWVRGAWPETFRFQRVAPDREAIPCSSLFERYVVDR
jgi:hypothetical protein